ncbi:TPA: DUF4123 domain-containing protein [Pseudomonas aeruginosa]|nr:DUF4123 domain-containing protein [Pseudomonas aeruginosa]
MLRTELLDTPSAKSGSRLHILIDPTLDDPFPEQASRKVPLPIVHEGLRAAHRPYLLRANIQGKQFERSLLLATQEAARQRDDVPGARAICGWIFTTVTSDALAEHLAHHGLLPTSEGVRLLRYWDPRVMDLMCPMLESHQLHALMGPAVAWHWAGRDAHLRTLLAPASSGSSRYSLELTPEQQQVLAHAPHVNGTLDILQDGGHDMSSTEPLHLARSIRRGAQTWHLTTASEHITYGLYCALVDEHFDQRPEVHTAMAAAVRAGDSAIDALDQFDDAYWSQPHHSAPRTPNP